MTIDRIRQFIDHLNISVRTFEQSIGASNGLIRKAITQNTDIQSKWLTSIVDIYPQISAEWLLSGSGEMLKGQYKQLSKKAEKSNIPSKLDSVDNGKLIPLYEMSEERGKEMQFINARQSPIDYIYIPNVTSCDGAVFIRGNSMSPYLGAGDIALFKQVKNIPRGIYWGEIYLISFNLEGNHYTAVQYLKQSDQKDCVTLANYDRQQKTQDIPMSSIQALAIIKAGIKYTSML